MVISICHQLVAIDWSIAMANYDCQHSKNWANTNTQKHCGLYKFEQGMNQCLRCIFNLHGLHINIIDYPVAYYLYRMVKYIYRSIMFVQMSDFDTQQHSYAFFAHVSYGMICMTNNEEYCALLSCRAAFFRYFCACAILHFFATQHKVSSLLIASSL